MAATWIGSLWADMGGRYVAIGVRKYIWYVGCPADWLLLTFVK